MKILHKSKRPVPPHTQVAELISKLVSTSNDDLADVLSRIDSWKWPRSDLNAWAKVLNKLDAVLEAAIKDYDVDKIQINDFTPQAKKTICEILRFERLLLENSTNRKLFNSYDRLNSLLYTSDLDVLILALNLLLRPSQQYSAQPSVTHALSISTPRLQSLAKRWTQFREHGVGLVELATEKGAAEVDALPVEARQVNFTFYRTEADSKAGAEKKMDVDTSDTVLGSPRKHPAPAPAPTGIGAVNVHIDEHAISSKPIMQLLADAMEVYAIPESEKFELLCRLRAAKVLSQGNQADREKLVVVRLLAIAIFGHTHQEHQAASSIFLFEPDLISHVAELLQVDRNIPISIQTVALAALDALARYRNRMQEVLAAVNAGVNHGLLMALFRKTISDIANPSSTLPHAFVEALLQFVTYIASHPSGGNMIVGAGLIPLLIQIIDNKLPTRLQLVSKAMQLVDNVLYSFSNAFNLYCNSRGVETLVERIEHEINYDIQEYGQDINHFELSSVFNDVPVARAAVLKHTLRSMNRMMGSSGTSEGLRGLIDMSLLKSIKKIVEYRGLFGPSVMPIAINIMATFVHNEPTSLAIIQEAGLPETFYKMIEYGLEPAIEVIQAIPNAIGALCLNEQGQAQLANRPSIIPSIFMIFTSERHLKILLDKEHAVLIGTAIDELIRHHPSLKMAVFEAIKTTLSKIEDMGYNFVVPDNLKKWYRLVPVPTPPKEKSDDPSAMEGLETITGSIPPRSPTPMPREQENEEEEDASSKSHDNVIVSYIDIVGRFLEGLFQHMPHCRDFITATDGLARLGRLTCLPCLPYDYASSVASDSMVQVMRTMTEVATSETLLHLTRLVKESLAATKGFWSTPDESSKLLSLVDIALEQEEAANQQFRDLITLHIRITLLSDVFATAGYAHGRAAISLLQTLMSNTSPEVITDLGQLHRMGVWENIVLNIGLNSKGIEVQQTPSDSPLGSSSQQDLTLPDVGGHVTTNGEGDTLGGTAVTPATPGASVPVSQASGVQVEDFILSASRRPFRVGPPGPRDDNAAALKHLTHGLPTALAPFFQAMVKMFNARRSLDSGQKKQITETSGVIADIMVKHLEFDTSSSTASLYTYYSVMLGFFTLLLVDERTTSHSLHTVQLYALYKAGGIDALVNVCQKFMTSIAPIMQIRVEERTDTQRKDIFHALGGLKVALHLVQPLISGKPLVDSQQTSILFTRDKKDTDPDYFEPHNFLVKMRLKVLPLVRELWEVYWLHSAPLSVIKTVVQVVLELITGDNEEPTGDSVAEAAAPTSNWRPRQTGPDEGRISALVEMGFPRSAVERALLRTHNNINAATELLLANPFPLPPDPPAQAPPAGATADDQSQPEGEPPEEGGDEQNEPEETPAEPETEPTPEAPAGESHEELRKELNEGREQLRSQLSHRSIRLIDEHQSLLFDLHGTFLKPNQESGLAKLIDDIKAFSPAAQDIQMQPLANRCRLLALILNETPSAISTEQRATLLDYLLALLLSVPVNAENTTLPSWLAGHLLLTETLLTLSEEPRSIILPKEGEPVVLETFAVGPPLADARKMVFDFCLKLLALPQLPADDVVSILRLFVLLTCDHHYATQFIKRDGLGLLFKRIKVSPVPNTSSYLALILRHTMEDGATLQHIMRLAIKRYFGQPRTRITDVSTYVKNCSAMAFRDPQAFIEATKALCKLGQPFSSPPHISLKPTNNSSENKEKKEDEMQVDQSGIPNTFAVTNESLEGVVQYLISELMSISKQINEQSAANPTVGEDQGAKKDSPPAPSSVTPASTLPTTPGPSTTPPGNTEGETSSQSLVEWQSYACLLMQCLAELLFSYDGCKMAFLSYSAKKRTQTPAKDTPFKHRSATLNFLLSELIYFPNIVPPPNGKQRDRFSLCNWAMSVIVALCVDSSSVQEGKDVSPELISIRKFVLETISRSIKELSPTDNPEATYGRLLALADLCHRLLTVRFNNASRKTQDETPTHIGKIMLEKNFVATLTNALAEVDLNYPNVRGLITSILRPLEYLTKIAIKMSHASGSKEAAEGTKSESESSMGSDDGGEEDMEEEGGREETPDLYRNSSLGMYAGEMEDSNFAGDDEMDEDEEDEDGDVEMGYDEDTGSEDTSHTEEDEDEEEELGAEEDEQEEDWEDVDEEEGEGLVENEDGEGADEEQDEGQDDDEEDVDEEVDEEVLWQDMGAGDVGEVEGEIDDGERGHPIHVLPMEDEEPEMMSEGEEYILDNADDIQEVFGFADTFINRGEGFVVPTRRHRTDDNVHIFGRARNGPAPPPEATTHPLLLDASAMPSGPPTIPSRSSRTPQRILAGSGIDLSQTIEDLIGGGALQFFQQVMSRQGNLPGTEIRVDVPPSALINFDRGFFQGRRGGPVYSASLRVGVDRSSRPGSDQNASRNLEPILTLQRWSEEVKVLQGEFTTERCGKLVNHVTLTLLPDAIEAKLREEKEAAERQEKETAEAQATEAARKEQEAQEAQNTAPEPPSPDQQPASDTTEPQTAATAEPSATDGVDADMADVTTAPTPQVVESDTNAIDADAEAQPEPPQTDHPEGSIAPERVTVLIHGSVVDITDTGIDPTFLEALPDDMREEVLNQHVRDQQAARVERPADSQISAEFLDALPPDIRAEIIQQEAIERQRRRREEPPPAQPPAGIDPASFIASLDPTLRQAVLMDQDDGFIQTLPSHMIAEAGAYHSRWRGRPPPAVPIPPSIKKATPQHDAIQLLDKSGIAILVRLLFYPQVVRKTLFKVLGNLCENAKTRSELFNLLLNILQDGTGDLATVDKSFAQLSMKNNKPQTPKSAGKQKVEKIEIDPMLPIPAPQGEALPEFIAQRCLEALSHIVGANEHSSLFFLTEHEVPAGLRKVASKKGKGKERQAQTHYPIVLLLGLLDRQTLLRTPAIMESVVGLLATVTRPLTTLKDSKPSEAPKVAESAQSTDAAPNAPPAPSSEPPAEPNNTADASALPTGETPATAEEKVLLPNPPQIPHAVLRLIVNILTVGECSGRTFQQSLTLIQNLSFVPDARDVIAFELRTKAQEFGQVLYTDLDQLAMALQSSAGDALISSVAAKFSPASSTQAKLLRVLKTIDYMYSAKGDKSSLAPTTPAESEDAEKVQMIYESFRFTPLWRRLGDCLSVIEDKPELEHIATVLLPLIEALMVVCKYVGGKSGPAARALRASASPRSPTTPRESMEDLFVTFTDAHRKILNLMVRNNPSLMSGSFSLLVHNPRVLDFDNKRNYFNQQLHRRLPGTREHHSTIQLNVRRARVFEDSFQHLQRKTGDQIKYGKLSVRFYDEEGVDAGGVTREWFQILARQMFDPNNALFQPCAADKLTYQPNKNSWVNPEHLSFFKFVGRVIGKAIYDGRLLDAYFARSLYRQLLGKPVDYKDVEWVDPEYYNSLCWILENDPTALDLTFSVEADEFGISRIVPLKENGESIPVTQENRREFVQLSAQYRLHSSIKDQIENLLGGFYEIIPKELITIFNEQELELLISGTPDIDVDEWRAATEYNGYTGSDPNIVWWWRALKSFNRDERAKVLSFTTGTSKVPLGGFVELQGVQGVQRFSIHRAYGEADRLPQAHTCFNQIDLPQYSSYEMLRQQLLLAINEGGEGFAFS